MRVPTVWRPAEAPGAAPEPEFTQNSIFQSLSNLTSGGQTGNLYRDLQRFCDALENVQAGFSKKFFFRSNFSPEILNFFKFWENFSKKSRDFLEKFSKS